MTKNIIIILTIIFAFLFSLKAESRDLKLNVGTSIFYANINNPNYRFANEYEQIKNPQFNSLSIGGTYISDKISITFQTNRFYTQPEKRVIITRRGVLLQSKTKLTTDALIAGVRVGRFLPALVLSNNKLEQVILDNKTTKHAFLYGASLGYLIEKNVIISAIYIAPNRELNLTNAFGVGINYLF